MISKHLIIITKKISNYYHQINSTIIQQILNTYYEQVLNVFYCILEINGQKLITNGCKFTKKLSFTFLFQAFISYWEYVLTPFMVSGTMIRVIYTIALSKQIKLYTLEITSYTNLETETYEGLIYSYQGAEV